MYERVASLIFHQIKLKLLAQKTGQVNIASFEDLTSNFRQKDLLKLFHGGNPYHVETSSLICKANQRNGFYMIGTSVMKELTEQSQWQINTLDQFSHLPLSL